MTEFEWSTTVVPQPNVVEEGDWVILPTGNVHWLVERIDSHGLLGVTLSSGLTNRVRFCNYADLVLFKKGYECEEVSTSQQ